MEKLLKYYVDKFNRGDDELYKNAVSNNDAYKWLKDKIPLFECPDKELEESYYFRFWTFRKHIKITPAGYAISEFLPNVPWSGEYNIINAPVGHHFAEGRWLRGCDKIFADYLRFFLDRPDDSHRYSAWMLFGAMSYEMAGGNLSISARELKKMLDYYRLWEKSHKLPSGLFWSYDNRDAMEYSASGTKNGKMVKGVRPTLNSYMYGEAVAIAYFAKKLGEDDIALEYEKKADELLRLINEELFVNGFYRAIHGKDDDDICDLCETDKNESPRELIGYIPFMFGIENGDCDKIFSLLDDENVFLSKMGMTTLEKSHPKYLESFPHECLWNGYVWPFATSQVLSALIRQIHAGHAELKKTLMRHVKLYAKMHRIELDGKRLPWIDEVMHPDAPIWTSREILKNMGWRADKGGFERGKDYNHSTFADLIITGIVGVDTDAEVLTLNPSIPEEWDYMRLDNLEYRGSLYSIIYDKDGTHYGLGRGLLIKKME